jgi:ubiquinone/menaquinone biosynthesis C-methylase UbiE
MQPQRESYRFQDLSYRRHAAHWDSMAESEGWQRITQTWFDESTADYWRHRRMYEAVDHLAAWRGERWLTIGDGQFGLDSVRLERRGIKNALPTDICEAPLKEAKENGVIGDYRVENAERLSFADDSFDFVFCKEAYHHFPRPAIALYEMLRVSESGVVLVEPQDQARSLLQNSFYALRKLLGRQAHFDERRYEPSGNYVYTVSRRELVKVCLGLNLPCIAFKAVSDFHIGGLEFAPASFKSRRFLIIRTVDLLNDVLSVLGLSMHNVLMSCLFKVQPPHEVRACLRKNGWKVMALPRNPYAADPSGVAGSPNASVVPSPTAAFEHSVRRAGRHGSPAAPAGQA